MCVCLCGWGRKGKGSTRVDRLLSASSARGSTADTPALAYWSSPTGSPLQVVCLTYIFGFVCIYVYMYMHVRAGADTWSSL